MNKKLFTIISLAVAFNLCGCSDNSENGENTVTRLVAKRKEIPLTHEQKALVKRNNDFAFNLFRNYNTTGEEKGDNVISPLGATFLLGMINAGAINETCEEITTALGFGGQTAETVNDFCKTFMENAPKADTGVTLNIANLLVSNKNSVVEEDYKESIKKAYQAEVFSMDFADKNSLKFINNWCNEKTKGCIPSILDELNPNAIAYLLNAIYFKGKWTYGFEEKNTHSEPFKQLSGKTKSVDMMYQKAVVLAYTDEAFNMIILPFSAGAYTMSILLPNEGFSTYDVINQLSSNTWESILNSAYSPQITTNAEIKLPRFRTATDFDMIPTLEQTGIHRIFDSNLSQLDKIGKNTFISMMKQKSYIEVNEKGAEMASVSVAGMDMNAAGPIEIKERNLQFFADHPFVYIVSETSTGAVFFIGTYQGKEQ